MAFEVLDPDAPSATANAYISVAEFVTWHSDRNVDTTDFDNTQKQGAIVQATDFIDKRFGQKFKGFKRTRSQALEWPRIDAFDEDNFLFDDRPRQLQGATAEYALLALQLARNLAPPVQPGFGIVNVATGETISNAPGAVIEESEKAGPLESKTRYADPTSQNAYRYYGTTLAPDLPSYPQADMWIEQLTESRRRLRRGS